jgi:predicted nucleic acid-binding Zn ribbon protein
MPNAKGWRGRRDERTGDAVRLGDIVDGLMREEVFSRGIPVAELAARWPQIVGERLATETSPASLEGGLLTVSATNGPWGAQARFLNEQIRLKANQALGSDVIETVRVVVRNSR